MTPAVTLLVTDMTRGLLAELYIGPKTDGAEASSSQARKPRPGDHRGQAWHHADNGFNCVLQREMFKF